MSDYGGVWDGDVVLGGCLSEFWVRRGVLVELWGGDGVDASVARRYREV